MWSLFAMCLLLLAPVPAPTPEVVELTIEKLPRKATVYPPKEGTKNPPVVFVFHGHGGSMTGMARKFDMQSHFPEAVVVYMQGVPTPGITDPLGVKSGWQKKADEYDGRDLKFFDAMLKLVKEKYAPDKDRIFATGHSNGGAFTYLLWAERGDVFAAVAPSASGAANHLRRLKPLPAMHIAGKQDQVVSFTSQSRTMATIRNINQCETVGKEWAKDCTLYASKTHTPLVTYIYDGSHRLPDNASQLIAKFFKEAPCRNAVSTEQKTKQ